VTYGACIDPGTTEREPVSSWTSTGSLDHGATVTVRRLADQSRDRTELDRTEVVKRRPPYPRQRMFDEIMEKFEESPSQQAVIRLLLERGFSVNDDGRVVSGGIEIPNTGIAREIGVDRRVVDSTTDAILADEELRRIFQNISAIPSLMDLAPVLDLTVLTIEVVAADEGGIVAEITSLLADEGITIRQIISDDPEFSDDPKLYIITDDPVPGEVLVAIRDLPFVRKVEF
jgi:predicted regulator of amino acid metabolism with ACT domain